MNRKWWHNAVVYQIYPRSFNDSNGDGIGDIPGIIEKLDYIAGLGVNVIWLSPIYKSPMDDNGYDISDYMDIAPEFGTMADVEDLIEKAADRGIKIVMDLVVNHTSDEHPWFIESKSSKDNPKRDWYIWKDPKPDGSVPNNWGSHFTRSAWEFDEKTGQYYLHLYSKKQPDLNWANPEVRKAVFDMMHFWLKKGIGGFRMDVINMIGKSSDYPDGALLDEGVAGFDQWANNSLTHQYLREMNAEVLSKYDILTVGETPYVTPFEGRLYSHPGRHELGMIFQFEHMGVDKENELGIRKPIDLAELKRIMGRWQDGLNGRGWNSNYWSNHDQPRAVSRFGDDGAFREESAKMLGTTLHMMFGTPYIYQGEELGLTNTYYETIDDYNDLFDHYKYDLMTTDFGISNEKAMATIRYFSRDNARVPMRWSSEENGGFTTGTPWLKINPNYKEINAEKELANKDSVFYHYRKLVALRRDSEYSDVIAYGRHALVLPDDKAVYAYTRMLDGKELLVVSNFTGEEQKRSLEGKAVKVVLSNYDDSSTMLQDLTLRPYESVVYEI